MRRLASFLLLLAGLASAPVLAQNAGTQNVRIAGKVLQLQGNTLAVQPLGGQPASITLPDTVTVTYLLNRTLQDIKPGDFVGSAARMGSDGKLHAREVHIFPESMRGVGEGERPMQTPGESMTNAAVTGSASVGDGRVLTLTYKGGQDEIEVGPNVRIVGIAVGDRSLLVPGAAVVVSASKGADGALTAR